MQSVHGQLLERYTAGRKGAIMSSARRARPLAACSARMIEGRENGDSGRTDLDVVAALNGTLKEDW
jgi:hypothetical protein